MGIKSKKDPRLPKNLFVSAKREVLKDARELLRGDAKHSCPTPNWAAIAFCAIEGMTAWQRCLTSPIRSYLLLGFAE